MGVDTIFYCMYNIGTDVKSQGSKISDGTQSQLGSELPKIFHDWDTLYPLPNEDRITQSFWGHFIIQRLGVITACDHHYSLYLLFLPKLA